MTKPPVPIGLSAAAPGGFSVLAADDLVNRIASALSGAIVTGRFAPGVRLNEVQLAAELGVSRAPLREAARLLENRGLVVAHPRRGFFVRELTAEALDDSYDLRMCLERHAGVRVCERLTPDMADRLSAQVARIHAHVDNPFEQVEADFGFHRLICELAGSQRLLRVYDELTDELRFGVVVIGQLYDDPHEIARTHVPVLEALLSRDPARWIAAIDYHIGVARQHVVRMLAERQSPT
jgi:DNA-binding GntR family transcriptional regulator